MKKDIKIFIVHILESISLIEKYTKGKKKKLLLIPNNYKMLL
jgi:uncharacterized protein with HEPN domain